MKEWYLIGRPSMTSGGYENEVFKDYRDDAISDFLDTELADDLTLYNYDLSKSVELRGVIQGNIADTQLKSMERTVLVPIGTLHSGDYIFFEDEFWIVDGRPGNNKTYEKATLKECQYKLRWQKNDGTIIERWANFASASKYDVGETNDKTIILTSNNLTIIMPNDKDSMTIDGKRVFIDTSDIPKKVFKITRNDDVLFLHGSHGGTLNLIADKTELNLETDRKDLRLCDYIDPTTIPSSPQNPDESVLLSANAKITFKGTQELKIGGNTKTLTGCFIDNNENPTDDIGIWEVVAIDELLPYLEYTIDGNILKINVLDTDLIDSKVRIIFSNTDKTISTYLDFKVVSMF